MAEKPRLRLRDRGVVVKLRPAEWGAPGGTTVRDGHMKHLSHFIGVCVILLLFATATARADWWVNTDDHPRQIARGVWQFSIPVSVYPVGQLQFVNAQFDFYDVRTGDGRPTDGIRVDYAYNGPGIDWRDDRAFLAIAPTLFDREHGFFQGWTDWDIVNGRFEGTVYATAPLVRVWFTVVADGLVHVRGRAAYAGWGRNWGPGPLH